MKNNKYSIVLCLTLSVSLSAMTREPQLQLAGNNKILQDQLNLVDRVFQKTLFNTGQLDNTAAESLMALSSIPESDRPIGDKQQAYKNYFYTLSRKILSQQKDTLSFLNKVGEGLVENMRKELSRVPHLNSQQQQYFLGKFSQSINTLLNNEFNRNANASDLSSFFENTYAIIQQVLPVPKENVDTKEQDSNPEIVRKQQLSDLVIHEAQKRGGNYSNTYRNLLLKDISLSLIEVLSMSDLKKLSESLMEIYKDKSISTITSHIVANFIKYHLSNITIPQASIKEFLQNMLIKTRNRYSSQINVDKYYQPIIEKDYSSLSEAAWAVMKIDTQIIADLK